MRAITYVIGDGQITALAGGPLSLGDMGPRITRRVSRVEFNGTTNLWEVLDPVDKSAPPSYTSSDYDDCLRWEAEYYNSVLATNPEELVQ